MTHKRLVSSFPNPREHGAKAKDIRTICANIRASIDAIDGAIKRTNNADTKVRLTNRRNRLVSKFIRLGLLDNDRTFSPDMIQRNRKHGKDQDFIDRYHAMREKEFKET